MARGCTASTTLSVAARPSSADLASGGVVAIEARGWSLERSCVAVTAAAMRIQCPMAVASGAICNNHGSCSYTTGTCNCNNYWGGPDCSVDLSAAAVTPLTITTMLTLVPSFSGQKRFFFQPVSTTVVPFTVQAAPADAMSSIMVVVATSTEAADRGAWRWSSPPTNDRFDPVTVKGLISPPLDPPYTFFAPCHSRRAVDAYSSLYVIGVIGKGSFTIQLAPAETTCPNACSSRGRCVAGKCECGSGFAGAECEVEISAHTPVVLGATTATPVVSRFVVDATAATGEYTIASNCAVCGHFRLAHECWRFPTMYLHPANSGDCPHPYLLLPAFARAHMRFRCASSLLAVPRSGTLP